MADSGIPLVCTSKGVEAETLAMMNDILIADCTRGIPLVCTSKGIEAGTLAMMNDILVEELGPDRSYAFLSGPSFAKEIAMGLATAVVVASKVSTTREG
ncbi:hypothetical protein T484DRAFT_1802181 [Baffinella frigidus]|nr:hypothetical protein T484DRAFT_1802181 [Cryptophyta sp. CCMP2293]